MITLKSYFVQMPLASAMVQTQDTKDVKVAVVQSKKELKVTVLFYFKVQKVYFGVTYLINLKSVIQNISRIILAVIELHAF